MDSMPINPLDGAVILVLLVSGFLAYMRGFVHEVLSVAGWIGAILATIHAFPDARLYARQFIGVDIAADIAAGAVVFVVVLVALSLLTRAVARRVQDSALNVVDRSLGFLFGLARGAFVVCLVYIGVAWIWPPAEQYAWMRDARAMPLIESGAGMLRALVPEDASNRAGAAAREAQDRARAAAEAERMMRDLVRPRTEPDKPAGSPAYDKRQREGLDRLIEGAR